MTQACKNQPNLLYKSCF